MDFIEIAVNGIDGEAAEAVSELFNRYGHGGAVIEAVAPDFERVTVRTVVPSEDNQRLRRLEMMLALIGRALPHGLPEPRLQFVGQSDWANAWKEHFHVVRIGRRFVVKPSWRDYSPTPGDIVIEIDPGLAFGSGLHPTTQLCLQIFEEMNWAGQRLFDVGVGSGILSIAALKLGATEVRAVDIDEVAVRVAEENFERNGLFVVANILAHILIELLPDLAAALAPGGRLLLSGMIDEQEADVTAAATAQCLQVIDRRTVEDWVALVVKK
jgi:ribosomal protein L11 methyltransferase